ncbi:TPA: pectate lyase [Candidatus Latescibacteria bacterium]|mgnify:CR=1 FL=1|nr:pectate lyase [Candidatus Latescibacterota bacterium]
MSADPKRSLQIDVYGHYLGLRHMRNPIAFARRACGLGLFTWLFLSTAHAYEAIDLSGFRDGIKHWNDKYGRDRADERYAPDQVVQIADNILTYQLEDGGWPKNLDPQLKVSEAELRPLLGRSLSRSTLDNRSTYPQIIYLAQVYTQTKQQKYLKSVERGLGYILAEQRASGGWRGADVDAVTYNDDVMLGVMRLFRDINRGVDHFNWLDEGLRQRVSASLARAIEVTLRCQVVVDGVKTAWGQQHSHDTFEPVKARSYELPAICSAESSGILRFLMEIEDPLPEIVSAIEAGVAWIERAKISGIRIKDIEIDPVRFHNHTTTRDRVVVEDPGAPPIWARYYEVDTNRPFFCNRDGIKVYSLAEVKLERRTGYGWYTGSPSRLLDVDYPAWKARCQSGSM